MKLVFQGYRTQYSHNLEFTTASHMTHLVRHYDTYDNDQGLLVIHAVLDMMNGTERVQSHQELGYEIFWGMSILDRYNKTPVTFIYMKKDIEHAVKRALGVYGTYRVKWNDHAYEVLNRIASL